MSDSIQSLAASQAAAGASSAPLGIIGNISTPPLPPGFDRSLVRALRFALQAAARQLLPREAVATCLRRPHPRLDGPPAVELLYEPTAAAGRLRGLMVCHSVWCCPVCAARISEFRRRELSAGLAYWRASGPNRSAWLVTFTLQHSRRQDLAQVLATLTAARARLVSGAPAKRFARRFGVVGMVRTLEVTHGTNGWHPHLHVLYLVEGVLPSVAFEQVLKVRWAAAVAAEGGSATLTHGCDVRFADDEIAEYLAKWGKPKKWTQAHEMTKAVAKRSKSGGSSPLDLLEQYFFGDKRSGRLWLEYAMNMKGQRQLWYSHGLKAKMGIMQDIDDKEVAEQVEPDAAVLASMSAGMWYKLLRSRKDAVIVLMNELDKNNSDEVMKFLERNGIFDVNQLE